MGDESGVTSTDPATNETGNYMSVNRFDATTREALLTSLNTRSPTTWARCSDASTMADAPLPCRTGDAPSRCVSGHRHCGDLISNTQDPWLEVDVRHDVPTDRDYYFFAIEFTLPHDAQYGALFFESAYDPSNKYYTVTVMDDVHNPLSTQCKPYFEQSVDHYADGLVYFQYACLNALASDAAYEIMRNVRYVRLTLTGAYRMIWIENVRLMFRTLQDLPPNAPPSPIPPPSPPHPHAPPDHPDQPATYTCTLFADVSFEPQYVTLAHVEPCGLTTAQCCALAYDHNTTTVFTLTASGCCTLFERVDAAACASTPPTAGAITHADTDYCSFQTTGLTTSYAYDDDDIVVTGVRDTLV